MLTDPEWNQTFCHQKKSRRNEMWQCLRKIRKDREKKVYDMLQVLHTTCLGVVLTISFNNRLNGNSL